MYITGILKNEVVNNGITYKVGDKASFPIQYGLEEYFEKYEITDSQFGEVTKTSSKKSADVVVEEEI